MMWAGCKHSTLVRLRGQSVEIVFYIDFAMILENQVDLDVTKSIRLPYTHTHLVNVVMSLMPYTVPCKGKPH